MKFREFLTTSRKKILAGKDAKQNEELVKKFIGKENLILHTAKPGSPFCVIVESKVKPSQKDIKEAAIFCASKSHDWRDNKKDVIVHTFTGKNIYKARGMKIGTFGVKKFKEIKVKKEEIEKLEEIGQKIIKKFKK